MKLPSSPSNESAKQILLIEDNDLDVELFVRLLRKQELKNELLVKNDAIAALEFLSSVHCDLRNDCVFLVDLNLPKMSGLEFLQKIKADGRWSNATVVMLTSSSYAEDVLQATQYGVRAYMLKQTLKEAMADPASKLRRILQ